MVALTPDRLESVLEAWIEDSIARGLSDKTIGARRLTVGQLLWWMRGAKRPRCGPEEIRGFLAYVVEPHPGGRWETSKTAAARPVTANSYHGRLRTFCRWGVDQGLISESPMHGVKAPVYRPDQIVPFSEAQVMAIVGAARVSRYPERDEAIVLLLLDTGLRASEMLGLRAADVDLLQGHALVMGKGAKTREISISKPGCAAYRRYLDTVDDYRGMPAFLSERGGSLTLSGLEQIVERLGENANIRNVRVSPHTFRHTFAVMFLRSGGHVFALKEMLGHQTLMMTMRYAMIAQADIHAQHAQHSPLKALKL